jgi:hypothetical protein
MSATFREALVTLVLVVIGVVVARYIMKAMKMTTTVAF